MIVQRASSESSVSSISFEVIPIIMKRLIAETGCSKLGVDETFGSA